MKKKLLMFQVDAQVGKHLFEECICKFLRDKTRILATHQIQLVKDVDGIIHLTRGGIKFYENYSALVKDYPEYSALMDPGKEKNSRVESFSSTDESIVKYLIFH